MNRVDDWPWQVWLAIVQLAALLFWGPLMKAWRWVMQSAQREDREASAELTRLLTELARQAARISDLEDLIDVLRKALEKRLIRENAVAAACEALIILASLVPTPTPAMLRIRDRAQQLLEDARAETSNNSGSGSK